MQQSKAAIKARAIRRVMSDSTFRPYCQSCSYLGRMERTHKGFHCHGCKKDFTFTLDAYESHPEPVVEVEKKAPPKKIAVNPVITRKIKKANYEGRFLMPSQG